MGGKGSGRKRVYDDIHHRLWSYENLKIYYELRNIMKEHNCSKEEARRIRNERRSKELRRKHQEKLETKLEEAEAKLNEVRELYKRKEKEK